MKKIYLPFFLLVLSLLFLTLPLFAASPSWQQVTNIVNNNNAASATKLQGGGYADTNPAVYGASGGKIYFNAYPNYPGFDD